MNAARQVVHILAKDIRGHALEIGLVLALNLVLVLAMTMTWTEAQSTIYSVTGTGDAAQILLLVAWCALIGRVVQGDGVAGKAPYWLTRPYSRPVLLASKFAFVLLFVHVPTFLSQLAIVTGSGVPLSFPQLFANQAVLVAGVSLPLTALAALTTTFSRFVLGAVAVAAVGFYVYDTGLRGWPAFVPGAALAILVLIAGVALACQYRWRSTLHVAASFFIALFLLGLGLLTLPLNFPERARAAVVWPPTVTPTIRLRDAPQQGDVRSDPPRVTIPLADPEDTIVRHHEVEVRSASGSEVTLIGSAVRQRVPGEVGDHWLSFELSQSDYDSLKDGPISVRLVVYIETFERHELDPIPLDGSFSIVDGRAQCGMRNPSTFICRTSFGQMRRHVAGLPVDDVSTEPLFLWLPVRLRIGLNPIDTTGFGPRSPNAFSGVSIAMNLRKRVSYTRQEVTFENIRLSDWAP